MFYFIPFNYIWRPPSLSELTPMIFDMGLTHLGSEASIYHILILIITGFFTKLDYSHYYFCLHILDINYKRYFFIHFTVPITLGHELVNVLTITFNSRNLKVFQQLGLHLFLLQATHGSGKIR